MKYFHWIFVSVFFYFFLDVRKEEEQQKGQGRTRNVSYLSHRGRREEKEKEKGRKMWIRKEPDPDGYFLLQAQLVKEYRRDDDMFLTAKDASSLTVARK